MNEIIIKRAVIFALILGALIGLLSSIPSLIGFSILVLSFFTSLIVIFYMKRNEKYLGIITTQQGAILGGIIGFFSGVGFFVTFCPMVCILHLIFKTYYSYGIPDILHDAFWLFIVIVIMVGAIFGMINSATGMAVAWFLDKIEKKPENSDAPLDIKIED